MRAHVSIVLAAALVACAPPPAATSPAAAPLVGAPRSTAPASASTPTPSPNAELAALLDSEWDTWMREDPEWASRLGDLRYNDRWPDPSLAAIARRHAHDEEVLAALDRLAKLGLSPADRLNLTLFRRGYDDAHEGFVFLRHLLPMSQMEGIQTADELADELRFTTVKDFEDWLERLGAYGTYADRTIEVMREGIRQKVVHPRVIMERLPSRLRAGQVQNPTKSAFYAPFTRMPASIPAAERERLQKAARARVEDTVLPALKRLEAFLTSEYLPACTKEVGAWQLPRGDDAYAFLARHHTTTRLTPKEIHELGLSEVARIRAEMERVKETTGFRGSLKAFFTFLRKDPRFYCKTPEELFRAYVVTSKRIDPNLVKVFRTLPRQPYGVEPIPAIAAPDQTTAYYRPGAADGSRAGTYMVNLWKPEARPTWEMMALTMHEAVPGHHLQIALAMEQKDLPRFRRHAQFTAFVEGWALYSESLGDEMGLYDDPYAKFGQLAYEMWRAVRLVIDTGMHAQKWDRKRAIDYFLDNSPRQELDVVNEVDRYIAWPGQALAYKVGQLKIRALRAEATEKLGERFDLRAFHDVVLGAGAVPLDVLEENVAAWIATTR